MKKVAVLLAFLCCCIMAIAQSGQMTSYERGRYEIANTALKKVTEPMTSDQQLLIALVYTKMKKEVVDIFDETTVMENIVYKYCGVDKDLVTDANFLLQFRYPEKNLIGNYRHDWAETAKWYRAERLKLEVTKTSEDVARERERNNYKKGRGEILNDISKNFISWAMRMDGEDDTAYHVRLHTYALAVFDSLAYRSCDKSWKSVMVITKGRYDNVSGELGLKYFNVDDREMKPLQARFAINAFDASVFDTEDIVESESHAAGLFFKDGLCYPSTLYLSLRGVKDDIVVNLGPDEGLTIRGDAVKIDGTKRFIDAVTPYLKNHVFDYSEYAESRIYRNALYGEFYKVYDRCVDIFGADPAVRVEQFMPKGTNFSRETADKTLSSFCDYCLTAAQRGLYGPYISRCSNVISLDAVRDALKNGEKSTLREVADRAVDAHLSSIAARITEEQIRKDLPDGAFADALALIFGMYFSGSGLDVNLKAKFLVEQCPSLGVKFALNRLALRKEGTPYLKFLLNEYPEFVETKH